MNVLGFAGRLVEFGSGEYLLRNDCNGGNIVFLRACHSTIVILTLALLFKNWVDPNRTAVFSFVEFRTQLAGISAWLGPVFAGAYAALYTRFASQWTYLAGVYNQIKAAQSRKDADLEVIAQWKAGFIEDAADLHLILKPTFASIVREWTKNRRVREMFEMHSPGGRARLQELRVAIGVAVRQTSRQLRQHAEVDRKGSRHRSGDSSDRVTRRPVNRVQTRAAMPNPRSAQTPGSGTGA
jgi:hypothetical protein